MKTIIAKLIELADGLDGLGLKKDADILDQIITKAAAGDDFEDYLKMFDEPVGFEVVEDKGPGEDKVVIDEPEFAGSEEESLEPKSKEPSRLDMIKRRHELMKLKEQLEQVEQAEEEMEEEMSDEVALPIAKPEDLAFEDEDDEDIAVNESDDMMDTLKDMLVQLPEHGKKLLELVKDNPEIIEALMAAL